MRIDLIIKFYLDSVYIVLYCIFQRAHWNCDYTLNFGAIIFSAVKSKETDSHVDLLICLAFGIN